VQRSLYVTTARLLAGPGPVGNPAAGVGNISGTFGPEESKLFDPNSGAEIPVSGVHPNEATTAEMCLLEGQTTGGTLFGGIENITID
jgi:hypothetical protein